jgi:osmotically inducible lipoprotein OsmB
MNPCVRHQTDSRYYDGLSSRDASISPRIKTTTGTGTKQLKVITQREHHMNTTTKYALSTIAIVLGLSGCAGMSQQGKNTAIGAGVGAVGGAVLTNGSALGTVGGAAVGGVVGHEVK